MNWWKLWAIQGIFSTQPMLRPPFRNCAHASVCHSCCSTADTTHSPPALTPGACVLFLRRGVGCVLGAGVAAASARYVFGDLARSEDVSALSLHGQRSVSGQRAVEQIEALGSF